MNAVKLSCEQVYNIWVTEPQLIQVFDLRPKLDFLEAHIPGAKNIDSDQLIPELNNLGSRLAVIFSEEALSDSVLKSLERFNNYVFMDQCHRWLEMNKPLAGFGVQAAILEFKECYGEIMRSEIIFQQMFEPESSTYTYIIADKVSKEAAIIDPVLETVDRDLKLIAELDLRLMYVLDTHIHADHITGAGEIRKRTQAKTVISARAGVDSFDIQIEDGQELLLGNKKIKVIATPGHTDTCVSYAFEGMIFTGDALLIRGCGRTDFQQGSPENLYDSVHEKLFQLPADTLVYPGHDYRGQMSSTIGLERKFNPRLREDKSREEFIKIMSELKLPHPKKIHEAVPANLAGGEPRDTRVFHPQLVDGIPEVSCEEVLRKKSLLEDKKIRLIDVRRSDEFNAEYGHIHGAELVTLGSELTRLLEEGDRKQEIVFVCRSGARSGTATAESIRLGYKQTVNMAGGMIRWNENKQPVERS